MQLSEWMTLRGYTDAKMAAAVKVNPATISRARRGIFKPSWPVMRRIETATGGAVTANDFLRMEAAE